MGRFQLLPDRLIFLLTHANKVSIYLSEDGEKSNEMRFLKPRKCEALPYGDAAAVRPAPGRDDGAITAVAGGTAQAALAIHPMQQGIKVN